MAARGSRPPPLRSPEEQTENSAPVDAFQQKLFDIERADDEEGKTSPRTDSKIASKEAEANLKARGKLVKWFQTHPEHLVQMELPKNATAREIIAVCSDAVDVKETFRSAGCSCKDQLMLLKLWSKARKVENSELHRKDRPWSLLLSVLCALTAGGIGASMVYITSTFSAGWNIGNCKMRDFSHNSSCTATPCQVNVVARIPGSPKEYVKNRWELPLEKNFRDGSIRIAGDAFRCCDLKGTLSCCSFYDDKAFLFCDDWPHRVDADGIKCPEGGWECMFKVGVIDSRVGEEITHIRVYYPPVIWPFILAMVLFALASILCALYKQLRRCGNAAMGFGERKLNAFLKRRMQTSAENDGALMPSTAVRVPSKGHATGGPKAPDTPAPEFQLLKSRFKFELKGSTKVPGALEAPRKCNDLIVQDALPELPPQPRLGDVLGETYGTTQGFTLPGAFRKTDTEDKDKAPEDTDGETTDDETPKSGDGQKRLSLQDEIALSTKAFQKAKEDPFFAGDISGYVKSYMQSQDELIVPIIEPVAHSARGARSRARTMSSSHSQRPHGHQSQRSSRQSNRSRSSARSIPTESGTPHSLRDTATPSHRSDRSSRSTRGRSRSSTGDYGNQLSPPAPPRRAFGSPSAASRDGAKRLLE